MCQSMVSAGNMCCSKLHCSAMWCVNVLGYDALCTDENQVKIGALGAIETVLDVVRGHPGEAELLTQAMGALGNLSVNGECEQAPCCTCMWFVA